MSTKRLSHEEACSLCLQSQNGNREAEEALVKANSGLVHQVARKALPRARGGLELEDLISEGYIGLLTAIRKFEPERGNRLSTVATWWIRQSVYRAIERQASLVYVPSCARARGVMPPLTSSLDEPCGECDGGSLADLLASDEDVEGDVVSRITSEETLARLDEDERALITALINGSTGVEIAAQEGCEPDAVWRRRRQIRAKVA
jgi:RNA polymerase sigma factor (sigma-70 family)